MAGIGHNRLSRVVTPRITTAHLFYRTSGIEAANMLLELIENEKRTYTGRQSSGMRWLRQRVYKSERRILE